ncbi:PXA domain-containing protein [Flammula alnicola]|nr:PXA domain-containing protein [Flammula alnicola]
MAPSLASRLLFHAQPLPPLLLSKNVAPELTPEIYDFIALSLRAYVSPWWSKITRYDKDFLPQISTVLSTVIRALDNRVLALDLPPLVFHDIPTIITQHYRDYRNAAAKTSTAYATGGAASLPTLFAHLQPHMAISPEGVIDREYYRQIVDIILKACLPPENYEPDAERIIIREVLVKVLLDDIIPLIIQPWFIQKTILDLLGPQDEPTFISQPVVSPASSTGHAFSFHTIIVIVLSALQSFSGMCLALIHGYKQAITTIKLVQQSPPPSPKPRFAPVPAPTTSPTPSNEQLPPSKLVFATSSTPSTTSSVSSNPGLSTFSTPMSTPLNTTQPLPPISSTASSSSIQPPQVQHQDYAHAPLLLLAELISAQDRFAATTTLTTMNMLAASMTPFLDKLLPHMLHAFLSPAFILGVVRTAKRTLFPNGYPGPQPPDPTPEEQAELRARLVAWRGKGGLALLTPLLLGPDPSLTLGNALDPLGDAQCNLRLVVFLLDRILVGLFPELGGGS